MNIQHSLEAAKTNDDRASGEENDKGQAHDCAVCHGHMAHMGQEKDKFIGGCLFVRILGACNGSCRLVSITLHSPRADETVLNAIAAARAESFIMLSSRVNFRCGTEK